jgi:hypothetical protein
MGGGPYGFITCEECRPADAIVVDFAPIPQGQGTQ